jgi:ABC-type molybdate transport system substrate-binding protein
VENNSQVNKKNVIPFTKNRMTPTSATRKQMKIEMAIWDAKRHGDPTS